MTYLDHKLFKLPICPVCTSSVRESCVDDKGMTTLSFSCGLVVYEVRTKIHGTDLAGEYEYNWCISNSCRQSFEIALKSLTDKQVIRNPFVDEVLKENR